MTDPYASSPLAYDMPEATQGVVDARAIEALQGTKPWIRLCSVIGFIGSAMMMLGAVSMMMVGPLLGSMGGSRPSAPAMPFAGFTTVMGILYGLIGFLYLFPSLKLWKYGSAIVRLLNTRSPNDLVEALDQQRGFWKFVGIMVLVMIGIYIVVILGVIVMAATAAVAGKH